MFACTLVIPCPFPLQSVIKLTTTATTPTTIITIAMTTTATTTALTTVSIALFS